MQAPCMTCLVFRGQALRNRRVPAGCRKARRGGDRLEYRCHCILLHCAVRHPQAIAVLLQGEHVDRNVCSAQKVQQADVRLSLPCFPMGVLVL